MLRLCKFTFSNFKVFEGQFRSRIIQKHFSIQSEHHCVLVQIHHAAHYITGLPGTAKVFIALMPALYLQNTQIHTHISVLSEKVCNGKAIHPSIYPSSIYTCLQDCGEDNAYLQGSLGKSRGTPWTSWQSITGQEMRVFVFGDEFSVRAYMGITC
ncbi:hypothetical protein ATANTOWER_022687 [Ataeniobius toweri]|uniref:Uncharacterized protein n=1 Tax=Ataeniobius toweri TaxID=208326 RepID=A0ABU7CI19_9TELE|nr:hypothetical protein [Ataeniobius toweri]